MARNKGYLLSVLLFCIVCISVMFGSLSVYADENDNNAGGKTITDSLTTICPEGNGISPASDVIPSAAIDLSSHGIYNFQGQSYYDTLYTQYKFYGKTSYQIYVTNNGSTTLTVKAKTLTKTYGSTTIAVGTSGTISLSGMDSGTKFYIAFTSDYNTNVTGYIQ